MAVAKLTSRHAGKQAPVKDRVSEEEWKVRTDLAAAYHLAVIYGWTDIILTHFSARVPGAGDQFLLNAYGLMFDEVTASNLVKVDHGFGIETLYGHLAKALVKEGQRVKRGEVVGLVGSTGLATGPHLHYMVKAHGQALDPVKYILE